MSKSANHLRWATFSLGLALLATGTGCQIVVGGQTLPSPQWMLDDVQYFPSGTEFKLSREAAAMQAAKADAVASGNQNHPPLPGVAPGALPVPTSESVAETPALRIMEPGPVLVIAAPVSLAASR